MMRKLKVKVQRMTGRLALSLEQLFFAVLVANLVGFGGLSSLPILRSQIAAAGMPADNLLLHSLAVGQMSPGPNGLYLIAVGYFVGDLPGVAVATAAILIPPLLVLPLERLRVRLLHLARFRAALQSLSLTVVALLVNSSINLVRHASTDVFGAVMVAIGASLLLRAAPPMFAIALAVMAGLLVY